MAAPNSFTCELKDEFKEWMDLPRFSTEYIDGVKFFLDFAFSVGEPEGEEILCPCAMCANSYWRTRDVVYEHLICKGFVKGYRKWINHGETLSAMGPDANMDIEDSYDDIDNLLNDRFRDIVQEDGVHEGANDNARKFYKLVEKISTINAENRKHQRWNHRMGPVNFAIVRKRLRLANEIDEDITQVDLFIATRTGAKGKELDLETQSAIDDVQDQIENCGESANEAFQAVFGKERSRRVRGYGRGVTKTSLKMDAEIDAVKRKHSEEILSLKAEMEQQMDNQKQQMDTQMEDMKKQVAGLQSIVKVLLERGSPDVRLEDLAALMHSSPVDANSAPNLGKNGIPHSSTSTHCPDQE